MRLLETFQDESQSQAFLSVLNSHGIEAAVEPRVKDAEHSAQFLIWVFNEDDIDKALALLENFKKDPKTAIKQAPSEDKPSLLEQPMEPLKPQTGPQSDEKPIKGPIRARVSPHLMNLRMAAPLTKWIILLCVALFFWNTYQKISISKEYPSLIKYLGLTPLDGALVYDLPIAYELLEDFFKQYPKVDMEKLSELPMEAQERFQQIDSMPYFPGLYQILLEKAQGSKTYIKAQLFRKIREGQIWRLFTPCILHKGLLHILFNMLWLWLLGRQVEQKVGKGRYLLFSLVVGIVSNTCQYLLSGPYFLGYSGVISGLGGFIWVRQKVAPWEGYTIQRGVLVFLGVFILAMLLLQIVSFVLQVLNIGNFVLTIANSAHIAGAICGMVLARVPFFYKVRS